MEWLKEEKSIDEKSLYDIWLDLNMALMNRKISTPQQSSSINDDEGINGYLSPPPYINPHNNDNPTLRKYYGKYPTEFVTVVFEAICLLQTTVTNSVGYYQINVSICISV